MGRMEKKGCYDWSRCGQEGIHLFLHLVCTFGSHLGEAFRVVGVDDGAAGVDQQATVGRHAVAAHFLQAAALSTHARHQQEMIGHDATDVLEQTALCGADDVHHVVGHTPLLALLQDFFEEAVALCVLRELEVMAPLVRRQGQQYDPVTFVLQERTDAVLAHVGCHGEGIDLCIALEERAGIHGAGVSDVATLSVGNDEVVGILLVEIVDGALVGLPSFDAVSLVEGQVGLVSHTVGCRGVDDGSVETEQRVVLAEQVLRNLADVGVETDAEKCAFLENLLNELLTGHGDIEN